MAEFNLGQVAFFDKGLFSLSETYTKWDFVTTADSTYLYIGESPAIGKPVTDAAYWKCIADGKQATEAADLANEVATHPPTITNGTWHYWDITLQTYVDSEIAATAYELYLQTTTDDPPKSESEYALYPITQGDYAKGIGEGLEAAVALKENKANKVTSLSSESTDEEYPSAKVTFDKLTSKIDKTSITNNLGQSEELVMSQKGVTEAIRSINEDWVGYIINPNLSSSVLSPTQNIEFQATELQRTGNLNLHKFGKSRIFNAFYPCVYNRVTGEEAWRLDKNDVTKKADGSVSNPDWNIHNIAICVPNLYRRVIETDVVEVRYDIAPFEGAELYHEESYHAIGEVQVDRTNNHLVSVLSADARFRGGDNNAAWDSQSWRSLLGKPATVQSRPGFETLANNIGHETYNIYDHTLFSELMMLYFANSNCQLTFTSQLTAEGYPQGGLGSGNTIWNGGRWSARNSYYPVDNVGEGVLAVGCNVGVKDKVIDDYYTAQTTGQEANKVVCTNGFSTSMAWSNTYIGFTIRNRTTNATATILSKESDNVLVLSGDIFSTGDWFTIEGVSLSYSIPVFFGLEQLYGHLWKHCSGINILKQSAEAGGKSFAYVNPNWGTRSATGVDGYELVGEIPRGDSYIKSQHAGWNITKEAGGSSTTFLADYGYHGNLPSTGTLLRGWLVSGSAPAGGLAGSRVANSGHAPSDASVTIGGRLRKIK